ncbi:glycoside hydrolase family 30 beta sandwich domain-containing protein [Niabella yanshanensis]|uniref:Glycoside hydrolase family 30 beta sandwich domain-containing protein n=1 Tax=Niabella yanshanensis TaxID=577386 RepID=A0ABZ0W1H6_9BACT|nr:glycoside hydrolase family 30 beta sandwich domain-containing protein [Niabella yanshanensis]WQD36931.1 glycoside hydrolase family 30 beta sandwich domain-containing protein [Niabella yanshanensis]
MHPKKSLLALYLLALVSICAQCNKNSSGEKTPTPPNPSGLINEVDVWLTKGDKTVLLQKQSKVISFSGTVNGNSTIEVDDSKQYQTMDGFGYTLTGGSAALINQMESTKKAALIAELFGTGINDIGISYIRVSMGASDLDATVFSYNDLPAGETDGPQNKFSIAADKVHLIPILKMVLAINPSIKIIATPWSPPAWMKDNNNSVGGSLKSEYYASYATYFIKYIMAMKAEGITINAVTPQNEPLHPGNNPSMYMTAEQQRDFIKNNLGPAFVAQGIQTKIILYDHNLDKPEYPLTILNDATARQYVDGTAFHFYAGDISAMSQIYNAYPDKNVYFTEQWTDSEGQFAGDLKWHIKNIIIATSRNWSKIALAWNLANDPYMGPHTPGGCTRCLGALTINGSAVTKNVAYYNIAHASKFVPAGSKRIESSNSAQVSNVAFLTPQGKKVMIVVNDNNNTASFNIKYKGKLAPVSLEGNSVATFVW